MWLDYKTISASLFLFSVLALYVFLCGQFAEQMIEFLTNHLPHRREDRKREWLAMLDELNSATDRAFLIHTLALATVSLIFYALDFSKSLAKKAKFNEESIQSIKPNIKDENIKQVLSRRVRDYCDRLYLGKSVPQNIQDDPSDIPPAVKNKKVQDQ